MVKKSAKSDPQTLASQKMLAAVDSFNDWLAEQEEALDLPSSIIMSMIVGHCHVLGAVMDATIYLDDSGEDE